MSYDNEDPFGDTDEAADWAVAIATLVAIPLALAMGAGLGIWFKIREWTQGRPEEVKAPERVG